MSQQKRQAEATVSKGKANASSPAKKASRRPTRAELHQKLVDMPFVVPIVREDEFFPQVDGYGDRRFAEATIYLGA